MAQIQATDYNQIQNFLNTNKVAVIDFYAE